MFNHKQHRGIPLTVGLAIALAMTAWMFAWAAVGSAKAVQSRLNCDEAWQAPHSAGAEACRNHGWTVNSRLVVGPHGVIRAERLPTCPYEDGSRVTPRCIWIGSRDGNGYGLSYYFLSHNPMQAHYVWSSNPTGHGWRWVSPELGDALAEGGSLHADTRRWERCIVHYGSTTVVRCADGHREVS